jgi:hypothetical protein
MYGVPVFIHWTFFVGGLGIAFVFGQGQLNSIFPLIIAYVLLILIHELGHAYGAKIAGSEVYRIEVKGSGGWCYAEDNFYFMEKLVFYAGGLIAQVILFFLTIIFLFIFGQPSSNFLSLMLFVFTFINGIVFFINLFPYGENDGKKIYDLIRNRKYET